MSLHSPLILIAWITGLSWWLTRYSATPSHLELLVPEVQIAHEETVISVPAIELIEADPVPEKPAPSASAERTQTNKVNPPATQRALDVSSIETSVAPASTEFRAAKSTSAKSSGTPTIGADPRRGAQNGLDLPVIQFEAPSSGDGAAQASTPSSSVATSASGAPLPLADQPSTASGSRPSETARPGTQIIGGATAQAAAATAAAAGSARGAYEAALSAAWQKEWRALRSRLVLPPGSCKMSFFVTPSGEAQDVRFWDKRGATDVLMSAGLDSILATNIQPIPLEVLKEAAADTQRGRLPITFEIMVTQFSSHDR